jgi:hypothetical protein
LRESPRTRIGTLGKNLFLKDSYFMPVMCLEGTPMAGLFNLVQLTLLFLAEHMLSQEWSSWEGQGGAKPRDSRESTDSTPGGVSGATVGNRLALRGTEQVSWRGRNALCPAEPARCHC